MPKTDDYYLVVMFFNPDKTSYRVDFYDSEWLFSKPILILSITIAIQERAQWRKSASVFLYCDVMEMIKGRLLAAQVNRLQKW